MLYVSESFWLDCKNTNNTGKAMPCPYEFTYAYLIMMMNSYLRSRRDPRSGALKLITTLVIITIFSNIIYSPKLLAESVAPDNTAIKFIPPPPPPDRSASGDRGEAASRGCTNEEQSLMALVPHYQETISLNQKETIPITKIWGLTTAEYPTFWFFIPYEQSTISSIEFVLKDEFRQPSKTIYRNFLTKPETPGIISISTQNHTSPLEISPTNQPRMYHCEEMK